MAQDWKRLAEAVRHERRRRGLTQKALADSAGVVEASVQKLERGDGYERRPTAPYAVAEAFGWTRGSIESILAGGEPMSASPREAASAEPPIEPTFARGMPLRIQEALQRGDIVDTEVLEFGPDGSGMEMVVVLRRRDGEPPVDPEVMRRGLEQWTRAQPQIRKIAKDE
jgi:transcriptional regulator with XRE-family HTH domain